MPYKEMKKSKIKVKKKPVKKQKK